MPATLPPAWSSRAVTIAGVIRSLRESQMEPAAAAQASFMLARPHRPPVVVVLPAPIPCLEGDRAVIAGELTEGQGLPPVLLSPRILSCRLPGEGR